MAKHVKASPGPADKPAKEAPRTKPRGSSPPWLSSKQWKRIRKWTFWLLIPLLAAFAVAYFAPPPPPPLKPAASKKLFAAMDLDAVSSDASGDPHSLDPVEHGGAEHFRSQRL